MIKLVIVFCGNIVGGLVVWGVFREVWWEYSFREFGG